VNPKTAEEASGTTAEEGQTFTCPNGRVTDPGQAVRSARHSRLKRRPAWARPKQKLNPRPLLLVPVILTITVIFVGWELGERAMFDPMSIGQRHLLLFLRALATSIAACVVVYLLMLRRQRQLSKTAEELTTLLVSYMRDPRLARQFENPHRVHCRRLLECGESECPMYEDTGERCWQVMALGSSDQDHLSPGVAIEWCHECEVFQASCPDELTLLGENYNNLLFLLSEESQKMGRLRSELVEREKMFSIGQIASGVAHEVGNPLSSISSIVQMLKRSGKNEEMTEDLTLIETHIQRISGIVRQLSNLARRGDNNWAWIDVGQALEETVRLISFDTRASNVKIVFDEPPALPSIRGIPGQISQVFINLSLNALDAMPDGGTLTITAVKNRGRIIVRIEDTGGGIPPDTGRRIFDPFFTTKDPGCGTGLGLAVSNSIVRKLNGTIEHESEVGKGTAFLVYLPVTNGKAEQSS